MQVPLRAIGRCCFEVLLGDLNLDSRFPAKVVDEIDEARFCGEPN